MIYNKTIRSIQQSDVTIIMIDALEAFRNLDFVRGVDSVFDKHGRR